MSNDNNQPRNENSAAKTTVVGHIDKQGRRWLYAVPGGQVEAIEFAKRLRKISSYKVKHTGRNAAKNEVALRIQESARLKELADSYPVTEQDIHNNDIVML